MPSHKRRGSQNDRLCWHDFEDPPAALSIYSHNDTALISIDRIYSHMVGFGAGVEAFVSIRQTTRHDYIWVLSSIEFGAIILFSYHT